jgi:putative ABC transport system permease protein
MAQKYFSGTDPVGESIAIRIHDEYHDFQVTGIAEKIPSNSSIRFDFVINLENVYGDTLNRWDTGRHLPTFLRLVSKESAGELRKKFPDTIDKKYNEGFEEKSGYHLQALTDYHLKGERMSAALEGKSKAAYSFILSGIALLILFIACFNYMNLSIGNASARIKEISVRKVMGAVRKQLIKQFWFESIILTFISLALGILLAELFLPTFNFFAQKSLRLDYFNSGQPWLILVALVVFVGLVSGSYPALVLSGFDPVSLFRGKIRFSGKNALSKLLIILQFSISVFLIFSTLIMYRQNKFLLSKDLGFESDQVVIISLEDISEKQQASKAFFSSYKNRLLQHENIHSVSGSDYGLTSFWASTAPELKEGGRYIIDLNYVDYDYIRVLGINLVEGRNFSPDFTTDLKEAVLVNEAYLKRFGLESAIGKNLSDVFKPGNRTIDNQKIIGVVKDFHIKSLHNPIRPAFMKLSETQSFGYIYVKIDGRNLQNSLNILKEEFHGLIPDIPFKYTFLKDEVSLQYAAEKRWNKMVNYASLFAILIACSGLFGLTLLVVVRRTKEIGIRKVLGASVFQVTRLINREFIWLVLASNLLAWPLAYLTMKTLLRNYAYRIDISIGDFLFSGILAFIIAVITVTFHAIKASRANPVNALRYE